MIDYICQGKTTNDSVLVTVEGWVVGKNTREFEKTMGGHPFIRFPGIRLTINFYSIITWKHLKQINLNKVLMI